MFLLNIILHCAPEGSGSWTYILYFPVAKGARKIQTRNHFRHSELQILVLLSIFVFFLQSDFQLFDPILRLVYFKIPNSTHQCLLIKQTVDLFFRKRLQSCNYLTRYSTMYAWKTYKINFIATLRYAITTVKIYILKYIFYNNLLQ